MMPLIINTKSGGLAKFTEVLLSIRGTSQSRTDKEVYNKIQHGMADNYLKIVADKLESSPNPLETFEALNRNFYELEKKEKNLNTTLGLAKIELEDDGSYVSDIPVDPDWITKWVSKAENVTNIDMQELWAKVLAGEIKKPGSFSKRALDSLFNMSCDDAKSFQKIVSLSSMDPVHKILVVLLFEENLEKYSLSFLEMLSAQDNGLIDHVGNLLQYNVDEDLIVSGSEDSISITINSDNDPRKRHPYNCIRLTSVGCEIAKLTKVSANIQYFKSLEQDLITKGFKAQIS